MKVQALFFAQLADIFGTSERSIEVKKGTTLFELMEQLVREKGAQKKLESLPLLYAVNEQFVTGDRELLDQDVVALMPPVAGG